MCYVMIILNIVQVQNKEAYEIHLIVKNTKWYSNKTSNGNIAYTRVYDFLKFNLLKRTVGSRYGCKFIAVFSKVIILLIL